MSLAGPAAENAATNAVTAISPFLSQHTATTSTTGASEVSGGSYVRQSETWGTSASGVGANTNAISVPVPASTTVTHVGHFSASTAGTFSIGGPLTASISTGSSSANITYAAGADTIGSS